MRRVFHITKGGLISESFSLWLKSPKKLPNHYPEHLLFRWIFLRIGIGHLFWGKSIIYQYSKAENEKYKHQTSRQTNQNQSNKTHFFHLNAKEIISLLWWPCSSRSYSLTSWCPRSRILSHKSHHRLPVQRKLKEVYQVWLILRTAYRLWNLALKSSEARPRFV